MKFPNNIFPGSGAQSKASLVGHHPFFSFLLPSLLNQPPLKKEIPLGLPLFRHVKLVGSRGILLCAMVAYDKFSVASLP